MEQEQAGAYDPSMPVHNVVKPDDLSTWELTWTLGVTPWEVGEIQPALREAIEQSGIDFARNGRALVPGCGSGYEITYIASALGHDTLGLDIAPTAIRRANDTIQKGKSENPNIRASVQMTDFFTFDPPEDSRFDLIYDYTFFVAIPPAMRPDWAKQMTKLVKPGGYLITLVFPILPFEKVLDKVPEVSTEKHVNRERLVVWKRL
ncbi:hypothetical protein M413DRAFT_286842 [Hebeloma cylindrosporum]|uniref:Methyltransferase domain-containing protein n=1 Tax=Hebeloma cylindrosporum TaxID=76867 RepID=A0A0C3BXA9_HEBCY|nr:hypothetical protein M413DRAFT_286842 [Hebeloma cylindrosporum h7]